MHISFFQLSSRSGLKSRIKIVQMKIDFLQSQNTIVNNCAFSGGLDRFKKMISEQNPQLSFKYQFHTDFISCSILSKLDQKAIKQDYDCQYKKENGFCCCCLYSFITEILSVKVAVVAQTEAEYTEKRWKKVMIPMNLL